MNPPATLPTTFDAEAVRLWQQAAAFAAAAHQHAVRRDGRTPYFAHPARVAMTVACLFNCHDPETLAIALLHDTIEDTGTDYDDVFERFGETIARGVACLTKDMRLPEDERERAYDEQLRTGPWQAQLVKLADVFDNYLDADTQARQERMRHRIERALAIAGDRQELIAAKAIVASLIS